MTAALRDLVFDLRDGPAEFQRFDIGDRASAIRSQMALDLDSRVPLCLADYGGQDDCKRGVH